MTSIIRPSKRAFDALREVKFETNVARYAEGSCLVSFGRTKVLCTASLEEKTPAWLKGQGRGWVTAEYAMLPRATHTRNKRDSSGKVSGRSQEIQRLIGRALRASVDLTLLNEKSITIDCDVIEADGGTRTAAITGGFVALHECLSWMQARSLVKANPLKEFVAAVSCGIYQGVPVLDLDYAEDVEAQTDANFVMNAKGGLIEIQGTAEKDPFTRQELNSLLELADKGIAELIAKQRECLK
jgi:ribonuclease PH